MKYLLCISIIVALTSSCGNHYPSEVSKIDSLLLSLDSARKTLYAIDTTTAYERIRTCEEKIKQIHSLASSLSKDEVMILDEYNSMRKAYTKWSKKYDVFFEEIETIPAQLRNLRNDLSKNLIEEDKAKLYLSKELFAAESITSGIHGMATRYELLDQTFQPSHEKILNLIRTLEDSTHAEGGKTF